MRINSETAPSSDLRRAIASGAPEEVDLWLDAVDDPVQRADQLVALSRDEVVRLSELLTPAAAAELLDTVDLSTAVDAVTIATARVAGRVIEELETDRAAQILRALDTEQSAQILAELPADRAAVLRGLLRWPEHSVAAHMVPDVLTVDGAVTAREAIEQARTHGARLRQDAHIGGYVFTVDRTGRLEGVVSFRDLVLADGEATVQALSEHDVVTTSPMTDKEEAARLLHRHRLLALPVVDDTGQLLGILTADDASDIVADETTEDSEKQGGSQPLDVPYLRASPFLLWRKRIVWLLVLFLAEAYTGTVLRAFEDELETVVALAFFIPLLIGTGGTTGTQISSTLIQAMANESVRLRHVRRILVKEMSTGMLVALVMAAAGFVRGWTLGVGSEVMITVAVSLAAIVLWSSLIASVLPLVLKKLRIDPAVVSAPLIATVVDGTGLLIYFWIARLLLPELGGL